MSRTPPAIRDHETIRMIGRGAFGEVWMARSVTGVLRAVKVIWREDYDQPEGFEREFEALKHYEPVSRKGPGLVPILQVGRSDTEGFYYYVMELADDLERGRDIDPATYRPHTLTAQVRRDKQISAELCLNLGTSIAEGLHYLHRNKLIHRDVKPSNLVFINGQCCLADIGLITLLGQRTFVGTEGFVAPEGPGTPASDIFSLGMVLYEASTGKDRLDFPDLPSYRDSGSSLQLWRRLQDVICVACATKAGQRYENAQEMALALRGQPLPSERRKMFVIGGAIAALAFTSIGMWITQARKPGGVLSSEQVVAQPLLSLRSEPAGAQVFAGEDLLGETPLDLNPVEGVPTIYQFRKTGYKHHELEHTTDSNKPVLLTVKLEKSRLPQQGERWINSLGMDFMPRQGGHISLAPVEMKFYRKFVEAADHPFEGKVVQFQSGKDSKESHYIVVVPPNDAEAFRYWLTDRDRSDGALSQEHHYEIERFYYMDDKSADETPDSEPAAAKDGQAFYLRVVRQTYGRVSIKTQPAGVHVFQHDESLGVTPVEIPRVKSGPAEFELRMEGFTDLVVEGDVKEGEILEIYADMEKRRGVTYGREWRNAGGMKFVPLGDVLMSAHETRYSDFRKFCRVNGRRPPALLEESGKNNSHPVTGVTRQDARDFCAWLTKVDQEAKLLGPDDIYRLPTDEEWSRAVGLPLERGSTPAERNGRIRGIYPWGFDWPPPDGTDNLADAQAAKKAGLDAVIPDFDDNASFTAPVGSLPDNDKGIAGLGGNVSEWVDTDFDKPAPDKPALGTVRGGNWRTANADEALSSARLGVPADTKRNTIGFRIVVARKPEKATP